MKITDPEIIKSGESDLIDAITADMDWGEVGKVFGEKHNLDINDDVEYKNGDIIVHNNHIAYQLNFDVKVSLSIVLDREGNYLSLLTSLDRDTPGEEGSGMSDASVPSVSEREGTLSEPEQDESGETGEPSEEIVSETATPDEEILQKAEGE
jgi:hypothetical protein